MIRLIKKYVKDVYVHVRIETDGEEHERVKLIFWLYGRRSVAHA